MKSPITVTQSSLGSSRWIPVDYKQTPFNIGMGVKLSAGAVLTYTVEHTFDDIQNPNITPVAFPNADLNSLSANDDGNYAFPVKAIRLTVGSYTSGDATLLIVQGGT
jgi:hypothetical protein